MYGKTILCMVYATTVTEGKSSLPPLARLLMPIGELGEDDARLRVVLPGNSVLHCEGGMGSERVVRQDLPSGGQKFFDGGHGAERMVCAISPFPMNHDFP